jgi:hypothetical protein
VPTVTGVALTAVTVQLKASAIVPPWPSLAVIVTA